MSNEDNKEAALALIKGIISDANDIAKLATTMAGDATADLPDCEDQPDPAPTEKAEEPKPKSQAEVLAALTAKPTRGPTC